MNLRFAIPLCTALGFAVASAAHAQLPQTLPLVQAGNMVYLGKFTVPVQDGAGGSVSWGGHSLGIGPDGLSLYYGCHDGNGQLARITIPPIGGVAGIVEPCQTIPNLDGINPGDPNGFKLGGAFSWNGRLVVSAFSYYDGGHTASSSHFGGAGLTSLTGPYRVGIDRPAMVGGYMAVIPQEWRSLFGGPALTGKCCTSIVSRSSYGPSVSVFNPDHVGTLATIPSTMLVGYPQEHQTLGAWDAVSQYYTGTMRVGGVAFPGGTRTVLFVARRGDTFCYGTGLECNDPSNEDKGNHGYPYRHVVLAYDANDLLAVKQGTKQPWDVQPYTQWTPTEMSSGGVADLESAVYDPATRRLYVTPGINGGTPTVHVYEITNAVVPPPATEVCGDGIDNDGDGLIDEGCVEVCGDGIDNDGDGLVDEGCVEVCGDGIDNDGDGLVDEGCVEVCDGIDNDGDGVVDEGCSEVCDGIDNDRDGETDEGCDSSWATPSAPVTLEGTVSGSTVSFQWLSPLTGGAATGYVLEAGIARGLATYVVPMGLQNQVSFADIGVGRYYVRVRATNANGSGPSSNEVAVSVGCSAQPSQMTGLAATTFQGLVNFTWTDPDGCSGTTYLVAVAATPGGAAVATLSSTAPSSSTQLPAGTYYARLAAIADKGTSDAANLTFTVRENGCAVPRFRTGLTARVVGRQVVFSWSPLEPDIAKADDGLSLVSYVLEAGSSRGAADIGGAPMDRASSFSIAAPPGVYFARVRPVNACGSGRPSADVRVEVR